MGTPCLLLYGVNLRKLVSFYNSLFNIAAYEQLSTSGFCSLSSSVISFHEGCVYIGAGVSTACKSYCDNDNMCKGYDYSVDYSVDYIAQCGLYTSSSCPAGTIKSAAGNTGELVNFAFASWSGCFKKIR